MKTFLKIGSVLFHPILMPLLGSILYFNLSPHFFPTNILQAKLLAISIMTLFIPIIFYFLLKNLGFVKSLELRTIKERRLPLIFFILVIGTVINFIIGNHEYRELFYFFSGIFISSLFALILVFCNVKASLHMIGISGLFMFAISLSILYGTNITYILAAIVIALGWAASGRLSVKAHNGTELFVGLVVGFIPQLLMLVIYNY